ncbi:MULTISPECIES: NUDIX hydrolase [Miniimonas]|nr:MULTISPECIES: NUDIX domain-containing protein [Miniimonas]
MASDEVPGDASDAVPEAVSDAVPDEMPDAAEIRVIHVSAGVLLDPADRLLLVRKTGTAAFMQPGGKPEPGESPDAALVREIEEEVGVVLDRSRLEPLGRFRSSAANEPGHALVAHAYRAHLTEQEAASVRTAAEIAEAVWVTWHTAPLLPLAPLTRDHLLPRAWAER